MPDYRLSREERETIIVMNDAEDTMEVTTWSQPMVRKVRTIAAAHGADVEDIAFDGARVTLPKKALTLRKPRKLTDEERQRAQENLQSARIARNKRNAEAETSSES